MIDKPAFLLKAYSAARAANHPFPDWAAAEAALESRFGDSVLCRECNNLFGQKQGKMHILPYAQRKFMSNEVIKGQNIMVPSYFLIFPNWQTSVAEHMNLIKRLSSIEPGYAAALRVVDRVKAPGAPPITPADGEQFMRLFSVDWATDPHRADKVVAIYNEFHSLFANHESTGGTNAQVSSAASAPSNPDSNS